MKLLITFVLAMALATASLAACPQETAVPETVEAPVASLEPSELLGSFVIVIRAERPVCVKLIEVMTQGPSLRTATLFGPSSFRQSATPRSYPHNVSYVSFYVDARVPKGETRFTLLLSSKQRYVALPYDAVLWRASPDDMPGLARIENGSYGTYVSSRPVAKKRRP